MNQAKFDLVRAVDSLRIEVEALEMYMERYHPGFAESYAKLKEEAIQAIDPAWLGSAQAKGFYKAEPSAARSGARPSRGA